jgi:hypothetical protein
VGGDVPVDSETLLVIDFMNLKIKPAQSFECAHRDSVCVHRGECSYVYEYLRLYYVSQKKLKDPPKAFEKGGGGGESRISVVDLLQLIPRDSSQQLVSSGSWELGNNFNIAHISG